MRTFWKQTKKFGFSATQRGGLYMLVPILMLCAWLMTDTAYAAESVAEPTYLFEVSTGAKTGYENKIDFFIITYTPAPKTDADGNIQSQKAVKPVSKFLFPSKDAWTKTYDIAIQASDAQTEIDEAIRSTYGYEGADLRNGKPIFQAYSTDQYLFTTPEPIDTINRVQVFASDSGNWSCRGMRVFRVDKLGGVFRWNTATNDCYIDFEGDLIAEGKSSDQNISWDNDRLVSTDDSASTIDLKRPDAGTSYVHHNLQDNTKKTLALRFDFADTYGAGLEALGAMSTTNNTLTNMGLAETMAVTLYYTDVYGMKRAANVPAVLNAATYTAGLLGGDSSKPLSGFAQQGESMTFGIFLPDFVSVEKNEAVVVTLGATETRSTLGLTMLGGRPGGDAGQLRTNRNSISENDAASFITMAVYDLTGTNADAEKNASISASVNEKSGAIRYTFSGDPIYYQPVSTASGDPLRVGTNRVSLTAYTHGKLLAPRDKTERYLFELTTDEVTGSGTKDDILMRIRYTDLNGNIKTTDSLNVRELSREFNGWWYGNTEQDIGYYKGVATGQTLRFFVPLQEVKTISDVEVWMSGTGNHDDWQMADLAISTISSYDKRNVVWKAFSVDGVTGILYFERSVESTEIYRFRDSAVNPVLLQQGADESVDVGPNREDNSNGSASVDVTKARNVDWSQIRYSMTFKQASQELGFFKERYLYAVTVHVGGEADASAEDGDCGSKNLFFFRLVFKSGSSSFVLANQQLTSDGFIAGASQTFYISTNQDYGDVTAVQIIPEDISDKTDVFDKLMIKSIDVKRQSNASLVPVWTVSNVGWIGIDYRDEAQMQSVMGMAGRGASELTHSYAVDGSTFDINFMLAIQTEGYPSDDEQFEGNLAATVYYDSYSPSKGSEEISDVTKSMYAYMNRTALGMPDTIGGKTISEPSLMHRAGHTDRFYFSLSDVRSIKRIDLKVTSAINTRWDISSVSLFMVNGEGSLILNKDGEYQRVYRSGEELTELAHSTSETSPAYSQLLQKYRAAPDGNGNGANTEPAVITINFTENSIEMNPEAKQWTSIVSREPVSENDTLNLFLFPQEDARVDETYSPVTAVKYTDALDQPIQVSTGDMNRMLYNDQRVFYATGLNAKRFGVLNSVTVFSGQGSGISGGTVRAIVQQVRNGVVIKTWELEGKGHSDFGGLMLGNRVMTTARQQHVQLQLGNDVTKKILSEEDNLAVAIYYRGDDPSGMELRSPYVYLTDQGYSEIRPGQLIDLTFDQKNVAEITGVVLVSMGDVGGSVEAARIVDQEVGIESGTVVEVKGEYGFTTPTVVSGMPNRMTPNGNVLPLTLTLKTGATAVGDTEGGGTDAAIRMSLGYYDQYGDLTVKRYDDIRRYLTDGTASFPTDSTKTVELLISGIEQLRWVELEPVHDTGIDAASWTLAEIGATLGDSEAGTNRAVNKIIREGAPLTVMFANVSLKLTASTEIDGEATIKETVSGSTDILAKSGGTVTITPEMTGSDYGWQAVAERVVDGFPASASSTIRADGKKIVFTAPENNSSATIQYRITVNAVESPDIQAIVNIGVESLQTTPETANQPTPSSETPDDLQLADPDDRLTADSGNTDTGSASAGE